MKHLEVTILGQTYLLGCPPAGEAGLLEAVARVDREMSAIREGGKVRARERIAVLAALNFAYALGVEEDGRLAVGSPEVPPPALGHDPRIAGLVARLDNALAAEGRLF